MNREPDLPMGGLPPLRQKKLKLTPKTEALPTSNSIAAALLPARVGAAIRMARRQREMTAKALGAAAGLSAATVGRVEAGDVDLKTSTLWAIERALELRPGLLFQLSA